MGTKAEASRLFVGLMSGTSLDGVDAALVETDGRRVHRLGPSLTLAYDAGLRRRLRALLGRAEGLARDDGELLALERALTERHADAVHALLARAGLDAAEVAAIGFHGQTILHRPEAGLTWQIGDAAWLADATGIAVVHDFRTADVGAGGQGAPLVPLFHAALADGLRKPIAVLNLGG
ncbi:MAG: anhydro-N-acetylmuramic acid kinase, partial [Elioraea sp.]|nr:anhydro-N-acetylmuramic acid kinase [Elioraea sp.]